METKLWLALGSCLLLGFRHGFDYDHLAAITDITSVQRGRAEGMRLGLLYALGHALTVGVLGGAVIVFHGSVPAWLDAVSERMVGGTLIVLGVYVGVAAWRARHERDAAHRMHSRIALLVELVQQSAWRVRRWAGSDAARPVAFRFRYEAGPVLVVGVIHGLGAETPSQLMLFLLAANLGGVGKGLIGLVCFGAGLVMMNTLMTGAASGMFAGALRSVRVQRVLSAVTVSYSVCVGFVFLFGLSDRLPALTR